MKQVKYAISLLTLSTLFACNMGGDPIASYQSNFDDLKVWNPLENRLKEIMYAKSGKYVAFVDSTTMFSAGIEGRLSQLCDNPFEKIEIKGYMYCKNKDTNGGVVLSLSDEKQAGLKWIIADTKTFCKEINQWNEFTLTFDAKAENVVLNPEYYLKVYGWCDNKQTIYFDDLSVNFY